VLELEEGIRLAAAEYRRFREAVGWIPPPVHDAELQAALDGTWNVVAREDGALVGIGGGIQPTARCTQRSGT